RLAAGRVASRQPQDCVRAAETVIRAVADSLLAMCYCWSDRFAVGREPAGPITLGRGMVLRPFLWAPLQAGGARTRRSARVRCAVRPERRAVPVSPVRTAHPTVTSPWLYRNKSYGPPTSSAC